MKTFNGGSITNVIKNLSSNNEIWITDTAARATRYANAQATGEVNADLNQEQAENTIILIVEANPGYWTHRDDKHNSLDASESCVRDYEIVKVIIRFKSYKNTLYGTRQTGYKTEQQVVEILKAAGIEVEVK